MGGSVHRRVRPSLGPIRDGRRPLVARGRDIYKGERRLDVPVPRRGRRDVPSPRTSAEPATRRQPRNFFRQALNGMASRAAITLDGFEPSHWALRRMGMRNEFNFLRENPVKIRSCKYLNNIVEQDHRRIKFRVSAMLGFKSFENARIVLAGIELIQKLKKGQYGVPLGSAVLSLDIWRNVLAARKT